MIDISSLEQYREGNRLEAKKAFKGLPVSIWETYSAFANTDGGIILLGVTEQEGGRLVATGVESPDKLLKDFWNVINNQQKISFNILSERDVRLEATADGKQLVVIRVPRAERYLRPIYVGTDPRRGTYRRNHEGDYHCSSEDMSAMFRDAYQVTQDQKVLNGFTVADLCSETIKSYRNRFRLIHENHVWSNLDDEAFLVKVGALAFGEDNLLHPTAAGLLLFGHEYDIVREFPKYFLDYREASDVQQRWTDRIVSSAGEWSGNIFDFFFLVINRLTLTLPRPFRLDGITRIDDTPQTGALREALLNSLVNADYYGSRGVVVISSAEGYRFSNPGCLRISRDEAISGGISDPRNATILKMFSLINMGERAGSGIPSIYDSWQSHLGETPALNDAHNPDRTELFLPVKPSGIGDKSAKDNFVGDKTAAIGDKGRMVGDKSAILKAIGDKLSNATLISEKLPKGEILTERLSSVVYVLLETPGISTEKIAGKLEYGKSMTRLYLQQLAYMEIVIPTGAYKNRRYSLSEWFKEAINIQKQK